MRAVLSWCATPIATATVYAPIAASGSYGYVSTSTYDAASGLLVSKTDATGAAVTFTYNSRGQTATRTWEVPRPAAMAVLASQAKNTLLEG